jgi:hypothetical protein
MHPPTLALLQRCSWQADKLLRQRGSFRTVLLLTERADGQCERTEMGCEAPISAADGAVRMVLDKRARQERDLRRNGGHGGAGQWLGRRT